jgi:hypothetical protein
MPRSPLRAVLAASLACSGAVFFAISLSAASCSQRGCARDEVRVSSAPGAR